jgi:hypothetical protein
VKQVCRRESHEDVASPTGSGDAAQENFGSSAFHFAVRKEGICIDLMQIAPLGRADQAKRREHFEGIERRRAALFD